MILLLAAFAHAGSLTVGEGTVVVLTDIGSADVNAKDRAALSAEVCRVGEAGLVSTGDGWWAGRLDCANGQSYTFRSVAIAIPGTQGQPRSVSATTIASQIGSTIEFPEGESGASTTTSTSPIPPAGRMPSPPSQVAPAEAIRRALAPGEPVKLVALSPEDAYYSDEAAVLGRLCWPTDESSYNGDGWQGGPFSCWDGMEYYFYKVGVVSDPTHTTVAVEPSGEPGGVLGGWLEGGDPEGGAGAAYDDGTKVKILDISPDDAFFTDRMRLIGKTCTVTGELHQQAPDEPWLGGGLTCKKNYYYFYKVSVAPK